MCVASVWRDAVSTDNDPLSIDPHAVWRCVVGERSLKYDAAGFMDGPCGTVLHCSAEVLDGVPVVTRLTAMMSMPGRNGAIEFCWMSRDLAQTWEEA
jgi:hypothetical protein